MLLLDTTTLEWYQKTSLRQLGAQKTYQAISLEPWFQFPQQTGPHFLQDHNMNPLKS